MKIALRLPFPHYPAGPNPIMQQGFHQSQSQSLQQSIAPQMQQSLKLLQVPTVMLDQRIKEELEANRPAEDLLALEGMDEATAFALAGRGVTTQEDLAELAVDEMLDLDGMTEERAAALILAARAPWFESDSAS